MQRVLDWYCGLIKVLAVACLVGMVILVFGNVVLRYGFNSGIVVSEEAARWLLVWLTFLGAIVALREHRHLGIDTLVQRLSPRAKRIVFVVNYSLMLYANWLLLLGSWRQMLITAWDRSPAAGLPVGVFYAAGVVFGVSAGIILIYDLARVLLGHVREHELVAVRESEDA
jgi:TRAP-type C4-dicarboxylate transport system permease small subunit